MTYNIPDDPELRNQWIKNQEQKFIEELDDIPCPDCCDRPNLTISEDHPVVAAILRYCDLCDNQRFITAERALALLPAVCKNARKLHNKLEEIRSVDY